MMALWHLSRSIIISLPVPLWLNLSQKGTGKLKTSAIGDSALRAQRNMVRFPKQTH